MADLTPVGAAWAAAKTVQKLKAMITENLISNANQPGASDVSRRVTKQQCVAVARRPQAQHS